MANQCTKAFARVADVKEGTLLTTDDGFTCVAAGVTVEVKNDPVNGLYFTCSDGEGMHLLDGQCDDHSAPDAHYVGLYLA